MKKLPPDAALDVDLVVSSSTSVHVGRLALDRPGAVFEYATAFIDNLLRLVRRVTRSREEVEQMLRRPLERDRR